MSVECWKIENDLCRCCHSEGTHKNLAEPCLEGEEEVYSEMLKVTLDINIAPVSGPLSTVTYTICEACIMRLQDAWSFKQQVLQCESRFNDLYTRNVIKMEPDSIIIDVKKEADSDNEGLKEERLDDDSDDDFTMPYEDGGNKSDDSEMDVQQEIQKPKPKPKPKAKPKAKAPPKKKPARPSTAKDAAPSATSQQSEQKNKDSPITREELSNFTVIKEGTKKKYCCNKCEKVFVTHLYLKRHINAHLQTYKCDTCVKEFKTRIRLNKHMTIHKLFDCPECSQKFPKIKMLRHRASEHGVAIPTCNICGYQTDRSVMIAKHQRRVHQTEKTVQCPHCDMKFFELCNLNQHLVRHNPVKKYKCKFCNKKFPRLETLQRHERIHTGDKRKVCNVCGERFVQKASLNYHMSKRHPDAV